MTHQETLRNAGQPLATATKVLILCHGRGTSSADILSLAPHFHVAEYALLAPQASQRTWYPNSFLAPPTASRPAVRYTTWLSG